jgi:serine protease
MQNFIVVTDGRPLRDVERRIARYLPGLDVRLFPFSRHQAVLRGTLLRALEIEYHAPASAWFKVFGITELKPIDDEASAQILAGRDPIDLPGRAAAPRAATAAAAEPFDWHLHMIRVPEAWPLLGGPDAIAWGATVVGQIDTGYTRHPAFGFPQSWIDTAAARTFFPPPAAFDAPVLPEPGAGIDTVGGVSGGHGTRIGSTICGRDGAAPGRIFFGAAPRVPLVPVRITDVVWINHAQAEFAQALDHLVGVGAGVVNVSVGVFAGGMRGELRAAIDRAYAAGVIVVCAAGNHVNAVVGPASLARTVAVAGVTRESRPWSGSSFGPEVDLSAPAADLRRASVKRGERFFYGAGGDGTSYAAALTTAAAALWLTHRAGELAQAYPQPWQRVEAFRRLARDTARVPPQWQPGAFGTGILDVEALLKAPLPAAAALRQAPPAA